MYVIKASERLTVDTPLDELSIGCGSAKISLHCKETGEALKADDYIEVRKPKTPKKRTDLNWENRMKAFGLKTKRNRKASNLASKARRNNRK